MFMTTLTVLLAFFGTMAVIAIRPASTSTPASSTGHTRIVCCEPHLPEQAEPMRAVSRNRWERRDLTRMLMTENDYTGLILPIDVRSGDRSIE